MHSMRLSLLKGSYEDLSSAAWQEIGVKSSFGLSGIPLLFPSDSQFIRRRPGRGRVPQVRRSVPGPKKSGRSPTNALIFFRPGEVLNI
jgi:hypothetical protein